MLLIIFLFIKAINPMLHSTAFNVVFNLTCKRQQHFTGRDMRKKMHKKLDSLALPIYKTKYVTPQL